MNKISIFLISCLVLLLMTGCLGVETEAKAESAPTDQSADYLYADGKPVGRILEYGPSLLLEFNSSFDAVKVWADGKIRPDKQVLFSEPDCQGEVYARGDFFDISFKLKRAKGKIFSCDASACGAPLYYLPPNEDKYYFAAPASAYANQSCLNYSSTSEGEYYYKVLSNNPAVTGIDEYPLPLPLTFDGMEEIQMELIIP